MQRQHRLLLSALHRHEAHVRTRDCFANRFGVIAVVLRTLAIRGNEARHHDADAMAARLKLACPLVRTTACLHAYQTGRQRGHQFHDLPASDRLAQHRATRRINSEHREQRLCEVNADSSNLFHDFPSWFRLNGRNSILAPRCRFLDGEVPIIR